jgi:hypothetical protein
MSGRTSRGRTSIAASSGGGSTDGGGGTELGKVEEGGVSVWGLDLGLGLLPPLFFPVFRVIGVGGGGGGDWWWRSSRQRTENTPRGLTLK